MTKLVNRTVAGVAILSSQATYAADIRDNHETNHECISNQFAITTVATVIIQVYLAIPEGIRSATTASRSKPINRDGLFTIVAPSPPLPMSPQFRPSIALVNAATIRRTVIKTSVRKPELQSQRYLHPPSPPQEVRVLPSSSIPPSL
jgi:hypothetical protein